MSQHLHIISFDVPFPPNYGGVIDVFYKLVWLRKKGMKIHLHCFSYGRAPSKELEILCEKVHYYKRKTGIRSNISLLPYTVSSRRSKELEQNLLADDHPILFEVLHTCYLLNDERFRNRKKIYRHSNIEHEYYKELSHSEKDLVKKWYLKIESLRLERFEKILKYADVILAVNKKDTTYFEIKYPGANTSYLPSFHANAGVTSRPGKGDYILFHGNLSVSENYEAASWLITNVFSGISTRVVIAGLDPPAFLKQMNLPPHITLLANPTEDEMSELVGNAQLHVLYTAQPTGLKLKLLNVLFMGRFVICNDHMLSGTGLQQNSGLWNCSTADDFINMIKELEPANFTELHKTERIKLVSHFDNETNAVKLIETIR